MLISAALGNAFEFHLLCLLTFHFFLSEIFFRPRVLISSGQEHVQKLQIVLLQSAECFANAAFEYLAAVVLTTLLNP